MSPYSITSPSKISGIKEAGFIKDKEKTVLELLDKVSTEEIVRVIDITIETASKYRYSGIPQLMLEVVAAKAITNTREIVPIDKIVEEKVTEPKVTPKVETKERSKAAGSPTLKWHELLLEVKGKNNSIHAFLKVSDPDFSKDTVSLHFPYKFHKERIEDIKNRRVVEEAFLKVYGVPYKVKCYLKPLISPHDIPQTKKKDDLLEEALEIFGGEVIE